MQIHLYEQKFVPIPNTNLILVQIAAEAICSNFSLFSAQFLWPVKFFTPLYGCRCILIHLHMCSSLIAVKHWVLTILINGDKIFSLFDECSPSPHLYIH